MFKIDYAQAIQLRREMIATLQKGIPEGYTAEEQQAAIEALELQIEGFRERQMESKFNK